MNVAEMTTFQIAREMETNRADGVPNVAVIPMGSIEQHGPLLPLNTDSVIARAAAKEIDLRERGRLFVYPCLEHTHAESGMDFAGGVSVSHDTVRGFLRDICHSLIRQKYDAILFVDGHSPNRGALQEISFEVVSQSFQADKPFPVIVISLDQFYSRIAEKFDLETGRHADWFEAFLFRQSGGVPGGNLEETDPCPLKMSEAPGIVGIPILYRSTCGVIGKTGDGSEMSENGAEVWQYFIDVIHDGYRNAVSSFCRHFGPRE